MLAKHYPVLDPGYPRSGDMKNYYYRPQTTKFAKVMFLHMSVILSTRDKDGGGMEWYASMHHKSHDQTLYKQLHI